MRFGLVPGTRQGQCIGIRASVHLSSRDGGIPRGRTYVRNGPVVDLQINKGNVTALISGSELYKIGIKIKPLAPTLWKSIQTECAGKIDSLIELLQGKLSSDVM